jgi:uncharacterized membrane protein YgdD (TMEM256/DUF423 family)
MEKTFVIIGSCIMCIGVAAGAFGAHGLSAYFDTHPDLKQTYDTAVRYHLIHGLAIFAAAWLAGLWPGTLTKIAGYSFLAGIFLFSGSLYLLSLTGIRWLGAVTPLGGVAFIVGWALLAIAAWRS